MSATLITLKLYIRRFSCTATKHLTLWVQWQAEGLSIATPCYVAFCTKQDFRMSDNVLSDRWQRKCRHNKFIVDESLNEVECGICNQNLNPMWVLKQLCGNEHRAANRLTQLEQLAEKTKNKMRCKCEHCGKMTKIHRR